MGRILALIALVILLVWAVYGLIQIYKRGRKEATLTEPKIDALWDLTQQYREIDPDLQEWFALNSATALGLTVDEFMVAVKNPPKAPPIKNGVPVKVLYAGRDAGTVLVPRNKIGDNDYLVSAIKRGMPESKDWHNFAVEYDVDLNGVPVRQTHAEAVMRSPEYNMPAFVRKSKDQDCDCFFCN